MPRVTSIARGLAGLLLVGVPIAPLSVSAAEYYDLRLEEALISDDPKPREWVRSPRLRFTMVDGEPKLPVIELKRGWVVPSWKGVVDSIEVSKTKDGKLKGAVKARVHSSIGIAGVYDFEFDAVIEGDRVSGSFVSKRDTVLPFEVEAAATRNEISPSTSWARSTSQNPFWEELKRDCLGCWSGGIVHFTFQDGDLVPTSEILNMRLKVEIQSECLDESVANNSQRRKRGGTVIENQSPSSLGKNGNQTEGMHFGVTFPDSHAEIRGSRSQFGTRPWDNGGGTITPTSALTPDLNRSKTKASYQIIWSRPWRNGETPKKQLYAR